MALKKLPQDVQSILSATAQIYTFKKIVEELVYNALDAESTSIAIRLHIQNGTIQVIDNGNGIHEHDFKALGQKNMTSKITDLSTLRSAPKTYGFRGEALANIVTVSQTVKIISRHKDEAEYTWVKTFHIGKEKNITEMSKRPSNGTTVEIKGFLYNLNIQKKTIDYLNELQNIKLFLEHLSLIHSNISLSLRDDSKNEIVFKIHKKRDVYQTLSSLFNIKENEIQELQVEKKYYKVRGLIGKTNKDCNLNWIYINGKFINNNNRVHKIVNDYFNKSLLIKNERNLKSKKHTDENNLFKKNLPYYFIFITCPYIDYVVSDTSLQSVLEFKNWEPIKKLFLKLVQFYNGAIPLKEIPTIPIPNNQAPIINQEVHNIINKEDTRAQVKKIMNKILGGDPKKCRVSQLHKGIKGKLIKRNAQKKIMKNIPQKLSKIQIYQNDRPIINNEEEPQNTLRSSTNLNICEDANIKKKSNTKSKIMKLKSSQKESNVKRIKTKIKRHRIPKTIEDAKYHNILLLNKHIPKEIPKMKGHNLISKKSIKSRKHTNDCGKLATENIFRKFEKDFDSVEKRSRIMAERAEFFLKNTIMNTRLKKKTHKSNHNLSTYDVPLPPKINQNIIDKYIWNKMKVKTFKTTYDLVQTILKSQQELLHTEIENYSNRSISVPHNDNSHPKLTSNYCPNVGMEPTLTFDSHYHYRNEGFQTSVGAKYALNRNNDIRFITKQSTDNFTLITNEKLKSKLRNELKQRKKIYDGNRVYDVCLTQTIEESMYTIEFSKTNSKNKEDSNRTNTPLIQSNSYEIPNTNYFKGNNAHDFDHVLNVRNTYTKSPTSISYNYNHNITQYQSLVQNTNYKKPYNDNIIIPDSTHKVLETFDCVEIIDYATHNTKNEDINILNSEKNPNIIFVSKSQSPNTDLTYLGNFDPLNLCETVFDSPYIDERKLRNTLNVNNKLNDPEFQCVTNVQNNPTHESVNVNNIIENVSHHFSNHTQLDKNTVGNITNKERLHASVIDQELYKENELIKRDANNKTENNMISNNDFHLKNRLRFLPKGMSQIFAICNSKTACDYILDSDYFEDSIYNNFANDVHVNVEIYEPIVQNVKDYTTANIEKVNDKLNKANASLIFDGLSLKEAKVLGQIDCKFIAAVLRQKSYQSEESNEYLVLFDQHAVHERISLEKNLADYLSNKQWKSVSLDSIVLNLSKDEVLYLHNYEDKFHQLGLQWIILGDSEVTVNAIPEAILGKNIREVENIIKAVRNLIKEEINIIKMQKGCVFLYPKSIMDLVFSEACRYAIKFGDRLSKTDCKELLQALSICKTPFQCAHGRPVMAVLMDVRNVKRTYKVNLEKIKQFILKNK